MIDAVPRIECRMRAGSPLLGLMQRSLLVVVTERRLECSEQIVRECDAEVGLLRQRACNHRVRHG